MIRINQQTAQIGVRGGPASLQMSIPNTQIQIQQSEPEISIDTHISTFRGNRQQVNNESGLKDTTTLAKDFRNKGRAAALRAAAEYKNDGNFIANPGIPGDRAIPMLAANKMRRFFAKPEYNIGLMPSSIPQLHWDRGYVNVNFSKHSISINRMGSPFPQVSANINFPVNVFLTRQPYINVSVEHVTLGAGRYIDHTV